MLEAWDPKQVPSLPLSKVAVKIIIERYFYLKKQISNAMNFYEIKLPPQAYDYELGVGPMENIGTDLWSMATDNTCHYRDRQW